MRWAGLNLTASCSGTVRCTGLVIGAVGLVFAAAGCASGPAQAESHEADNTVVRTRRDRPAPATTTPAQPAASDAASARTPVAHGPAPAPAQDAGAPPAPEPGAAKPADSNDWRPGWWITQPRRQGDEVTVAAMADDADLISARRDAVSRGLDSLKAALGVEPAEPRIASIDAVELPGGTFRAFVLVTGGP